MESSQLEYELAKSSATLMAFENCSLAEVGLFVTYSSQPISSFASEFAASMEQFLLYLCLKFAYVETVVMMILTT